MDDRLTSLPSFARNVRLYCYRLRLTKPLVLPGGEIRAREGILVRLEDDRGNVGWGDAAPLPGFSRETAEDVVRAGRRWADGRADEGPPSLAFAVDTAIMNLHARRQSVRLDTLLGARRLHVDINALIADSEDVLVRAQAISAKSTRTVKLKVGSRGIEQDASRVHQLRDAMGPDAIIRLDANRAWDPGDALRFMDRIASAGVQYIEEPLREPGRLAALAEDAVVPIAIDETTREIEPHQLDDWPWCAAVVLKPTLLGSLERYRGFAQAAGRNGMKVVVSGAFESGVATQMLIGLASALPVATAHGLEPYGRLEEDVLVPRLPVLSASVSVTDGMVERDVACAILEEIR